MIKILVVDDEDGIIDLLDEYLSEHGFDVISAKDGFSALKQVYSERPDVVLLDLRIPGLNGYQVLRELRLEPTTENLPVILHTAVSAEEGEQIAAQLGVNHYLNKPWKLDSLEAVIKVALRELEGSGWARPSAAQFRNVNKFRVDDVIPTAGHRPDLQTKQVKI